jgi:hypothetical protein
MEPISSVLAERRKTHGKFEDHARLTREMMMVMEASWNWKDLAYEYQEAIHMIIHKLGRIGAGHPYLQDHVDDIIGYATLMKQFLTRISESSTPSPGTPSDPLSPECEPGTDVRPPARW